MVVPGLVWLPLHRLAVDRDVIPEQAIGPLGDDLAPLGSIGLWAVLLGLSLAPTVAAARTGGRSWSAGGAAGHPALGFLAGRTSSGPVWRVGFPAITFGTSLALAEVTASTGGLIDRFIDAVDQGRSEDLLGLATPVIVAGALLVPMADLGSSVLRRVERPYVPGVDRVQPGPGPALAALGLVLVVAAAAIAGQVGGSGSNALGTAFAGPSFGGPWLGTDELGRSVAARTGQALGVTIAGSVIPALFAAVAGAGLAFFRRTQRPASQSAIDVAVDLASWPAMLVVPLAAWPVAGSPRSLLDPVVLQIMGLLLVPMATRLLVRPVAGVERLARLVATVGVLSAVALAVQLLAGFVVPLGEDERPGLGHLVATGLDDVSSSPWPLVSALVAAVLTGTALHWSIGALSRVGRVMASSGGEVWSATDPDGALLVADPVPAETDGVAAPEVPARVILADDLPAAAGTVVGVADGPVLPRIPDPPQPPVAPQPPQVPGDRTEIDLEGAETDEEAIDIRDDITVDSVVDPPPSDDGTGSTIEDEAAQTVELRPADLRRAGVQPEPN